jgi:signal transduction histidine kinase
MKDVVLSVSLFSMFSIMTTAAKSLRSLQISDNRAARYFASVLAVGFALLARWALNPLLGSHLPYVTLFPAMAFCAWYCGVWPSVVTLILGLLAAQYKFVLPEHSYRNLSTAHVVGTFAVLAASLIIVAIAEMNRRREQQLRLEQGKLEEKVQERTVELDLANKSLRQLSSRLLQLQDDERRRIARELHDSVGQMLAALNMNLSAVAADIERLAKTASMVTDSAALVGELSKEIRTISHLLHPPLLDEAGLSSALRWYVDGFVERSQIKVDLDIAPDLGRLPRELETAIFRIVQECLTNVHRHSGSPTARIRIGYQGHEVRVEVRDEGKGIPAEKRRAIASTGIPGVGIRGMRERVRQLGGVLEVNSDGNGTNVMVSLPLAGASTTIAA